MIVSLRGIAQGQRVCETPYISDITDIEGKKRNPNLSDSLTPRTMERLVRSTFIWLHQVYTPARTRLQGKCEDVIARQRFRVFRRRPIRKVHHLILLVPIAIYSDEPNTQHKNIHLQAASSVFLYGISSANQPPNKYKD